jgi:hypothetical protein
MNNFWRGAFLVAVGIFAFYVAAFRPAFLKSIKRGDSNYHVSPLGAGSLGFFCFALGIAAMLNGLNKLSGVYVYYVFALAIGQFLAVGLYDSNRKSRLGSASPFYVKPPSDDSGKTKGIELLASLAVIISLGWIIHSLFPTLKTGSLKFYSVIGFVVLIWVICLIMIWQSGRALKRFEKEKKKALDKTGKSKTFID